MPYIKEDARNGFDVDLAFVNPRSAGEIQYVIARIIQNYISHLPIASRYQDINDILGALEGAKLEFYRRVVAPYEDTKIAENGDVY